MGFEKVYITKQGALLAAKTLQGKEIKFDHVEIGSGALTGNAIDKTALTTKVLECQILKVEIKQDTQASVAFMFKNTDVTDAFYFKEIGLFAIDPDTKNKILYAYTNAGNTAEYINNSIAEKIEKHIQINIVVDNANNVTIKLDDTQIYVTKKELNEKVENFKNDMLKRYSGESITAITSNGFGKIRRLYGNTVQKNNKTRCVGDDINMLNINVNESVLGVTVSTDNNVVTISGNSTEDGFFVLWKGTLKKGTYHVRAFDTAGATTTTILRIRKGTDVIATGHMFSFTLQQDTEILVDLWFNSEFNGMYKYAPKMVKDNPITTWSPYKYGTVEIISKKEEVESRNITYVKSPLCCIKNEEGKIIAQDILDYENKKIIRQCKYEIINGEPAITQLPEIIEEKLQCSDKIEQYDNKTTIYCRDEAVIELTLSDNKAISEINSNMKNIEDNMVLNIEEEKENITNKAFNGKQIYEYMIPIEQAQINSNANLIISHNIEDLKIDKLLQLSGIIKTKVSKYWYTVPSNYNTTPITLRLLDTQLQLIIPKEMSAEQFVEKGYITLLYTKNE